jgi:sec-independent protein translocase protein TatC
MSLPSEAPEPRRPPTAPPSPPSLPPPPSRTAELAQMSLLDHLNELRRRIVYSLVALIAAFLVCWNWVEEIYAFLERPIHPHLPPGTKLSYLGPTDPLMLYIKVALLAGVFLAAPVLLYQAWRFVSPGLYRRERLWAVPFIVLGTLFFLGGGAFAYYVAFPFAVEFLLGVGEQFQAVITIERYFRFLMTVILGLGLMFELPIVIFILSAAGVVTPGFLIRKFRWAVLLIFLVSAIVTPTPDVFNLCLFAVPTIGLYLLGVGAAALVHRKKNKKKPPL